MTLKFRLWTRKTFNSSTTAVFKLDTWSLSVGDPTRLGSSESINEFKAETLSVMFKESITKNDHAPTAMFPTPFNPTKKTIIKATLLLFAKFN